MFYSLYLGLLEEQEEIENRKRLKERQSYQKVIIDLIEKKIIKCNQSQ